MYTCVYSAFAKSNLCFLFGFVYFADCAHYSVFICDVFGKRRWQVQRSPLSKKQLGRYRECNGFIARVTVARSEVTCKCIIKRQSST